MLAHRLTSALALLVLTLFAVRDARAQTAVSGEAYGVSASTGLITVTEFPDVVLAPEGGSAFAAAAALNLVGLLSTGALAVSTEGTTTSGTASSQSTSTVEQVSILGGLITADIVTARASSTCDGTTATSSAAGTGLTNLVVAGVPIGVLPPPNTIVGIPLLGSVTINEQIAGGDGINTSSLTVNLLHVHVSTILLGSVDIVIASAHSDVACVGPVPTPTATPAGCVPGAPPQPGAPIVSGEAYDLFAAVPPVSIPKNPDVILAPQGGSLAASISDFTQPGVISASTLVVNTNGTTSPTMASSDSTASVEDLDILAGLVTATLAQAVSSSSCDGQTATSTAANTMFANLVVAGMPVGNTPAPNTVIGVPNVATVTLNEQVPGGNGTTSSALTVNLIHVVLANGLGEVIVSSAHSGVDCAPVVVPGPGPTCTPVVILTPTPNLPTPTTTVTPTSTAPTPTPPAATMTATPIPTATATPDPGTGHHLCYEVHGRPINLPGVSLVDQFGSSTVMVKRAKRICLPVDKNDEDPLAVGRPEHLTVFTHKLTAPRPFVRRRNLTITNQFGSITFDAIKTDRLLVPTSRSLANIPPPPMFPTLDHFKCYRVELVKQRVAGIKLDDQFGTLTVDIKKPTHLCVAADKNGEGIPTPGEALMCYHVRLANGAPKPHKQLPDRLYVTNQFGSSSMLFFGPKELCVPSTVVP